MKRNKLSTRVLMACAAVGALLYVTGCPGAVGGGSSGGGTTPPSTPGIKPPALGKLQKATIKAKDFPEGDFTSYEITWAPEGGDQKQPISVAPQDIKDITITGLDGDTDYTFTITGIAQVGEPVEVTKTIGADTVAARAAAVRVLEPADFNEVDAAATEVEVTWEPQNSIPQPYRVALTDAKANGLSIEGFAPEIYKFNLQGLKTEQKAVEPDFVIIEPDYTEALESGYAALEAENYGTAVERFMQAYEIAQNNETRMHAALAYLASISVDSAVVDLMRDKLGFVSYPAELNALINLDNWWTDHEWENGYYTGVWNEETQQWEEVYIESIDSAFFPELSEAPEWIRSLGAMHPGALWMCILLNNHLDGVNGTVDTVVNDVFGARYDKAVSLINEMVDDTPVDIDSRLIKLLNLTETIGEDTVMVTKAELKLITAALSIVKGTFEFLQAYELDTDANFIPFLINPDSATDAAAREFFNGGKYSASYDPLANGFMTQRAGYTTQTAKNTLSGAVSDIIGAYDSLLASGNRYPQAVTDVLKKYEGWKTVAQELRTAINTEGVWSFPEMDNEGIPKDGTTLFQLDCACLADGWFSMDKFVKIDKATGKPSFGVWGWDPMSGDIEAEITSLDKLTAYQGMEDVRCGVYVGLDFLSMILDPNGDSMVADDYESRYSVMSVWDVNDPIHVQLFTNMFNFYYGK